MKTERKYVDELTFEECSKINAGKSELIGWAEINGVWIAVYRDV